MISQGTEADIFSANVRRYAGYKRLSMSALAEILGIPPSTMSNYWSGKRTWPLDAVLKLSAALDVSVAELFGQTAVGDVIAIPVAMDAAASAGDGAFALDYSDIEPVPFPKDWLRGLGDPAHLAMIQVKGDSMFPVINSGDWVIFDRSRTGPADGIYLIRHEDELLVKQIAFFDAEIRIRSANRHWPEKAVAYSALEDPSILQIIGRVVWAGHLFT